MTAPKSELVAFCFFFSELDGTLCVSYGLFKRELKVTPELGQGKALTLQ